MGDLFWFILLASSAAEAGAPFEVLLTADDETPEKLMKEGAAVSGSAFTYAIGKLVLWSAKPGLVDSAGAVLKEDFAHLSWASSHSPTLPGVEAMKALRVYEAISKIVTAENITQAYQFISSGNAELGFVALSQVLKDGKIDGSSWLVPANLYSPIRQDAVILEKGRGKPAVDALMKYIRGDKAKAIIKSFGYELS